MPYLNRTAEKLLITADIIEWQSVLHKQATFMETSGFDPKKPGPLAKQIASRLAAILLPSSQSMVTVGTPWFHDLMTYAIHSEFPLRSKLRV